jgi:tRNA threonylcarbamoyladenosine biosynthesis protein TsaB
MAMTNGTRTPRDGARWLLAIDTATDQAGIGLSDGERFLEASWPGGRQQTTRVLPAIEWLHSQAGIAIEDIGAIGVAIGPGSFTGLRVGLSIGKGMATLQDRALIGVGTLETIAAPWRTVGASCIALIPAGRERVVWAASDPGAPLTSPTNDSFVALLERLGDFPGWPVVGELSADQRRQVADRHGALLPHALSVRRPGVLAEMAYERWKRGDVDDPVSLEPVYIHGQPNPR